MGMARLIVTAVLVEGRSKSEVARDYGVSRRWVITLVARYLAEGDAGLEPRSRRPVSQPAADPARGRGRDRPTAQGARPQRARGRRGHHPQPAAPRARHGARDEHDLADPDRPRLRHPAAPQAPQEQLHPVPGRAAQRALADRPHPLDARRRHRRRDRQLDRRPLPLLPRQPRPHRPQGHRRRHPLPPDRPTARRSHSAAHRQRRRLHRPVPRRWPRHPRADPGLPRRGHDALPRLPPPDLRQGRDASTRPSRSTSRPSHEPAPCGSCNASSTPSATTTTTSGRTARSPAAPPPRPTPPAPKPTVTGTPLIDPHYRVRHDTIDSTGVITLRHNSRLHHIGLGRRHARKKVLVLIKDLDIRVITSTGQLLRELTLDPTRDYQPQPPQSTMSRDTV